MTLLPWPSWQVKARLDLEPYKLNTVCPITGRTWGLEDHHIWRRSFGAEYREAWWVELEDGRVVPNRVALNAEAHRNITENRTSLQLIDTAGGLIFHFVDEDGAPLPINVGSLGGADDDVIVGAPAVTPDAAECNHGEDEEACKPCKGTGRRKKRQPNRQGEDRPKQAPRTVSIRIPRTEERGFELLTNLHSAAEVILVEQGILRERGQGAGYYRDFAIYAKFVQEHRELLPADWGQEDAQDGAE